MADAYTRRVIDFSSTEADFGPRLVPGSRAFAEEAGAAPRLEVHDYWPPGLAPQPVALPAEPSIYDPLPQADYVVVTWTVAELEALAAVMTPGVSRHSWYRYARGFDQKYLPYIREGAPARKARRLGSYYLCTIGDARVLCFKSELHLNQDGIDQPSGYATLPVKDLFKQLVREVKPRLLLTIGTAGATFPEHDLGDVFVTRAAKFRCAQEFEKAPYNGKTYRSTLHYPTGQLATARALVRLQDAHLVEPDFAPPSAHYPWPGAPLSGKKHKPVIRVDGGSGSDDLPEFLPILTTDFFEFGTTKNNLWEVGCGVEMGDAALGLAMEELGDEACPWVVVRNASDPAINADLSDEMQRHWAVWFYEKFGFWTSVNGAIATWALISG